MIRTLDPVDRAAVNAADANRAAAEHAAASARRELAQLVAELRDRGVTYAAVAAVIGVSPQRIHQIASTRP